MKVRCNCTCIHIRPMFYSNFIRHLLFKSIFDLEMFLIFLAQNKLVVFFRNACLREMKCFFIHKYFCNCAQNVH